MKKLLSTICALLLCTYASAYDFEVNGIYYNILSEEEKTCEVTYKNFSEENYSGEIIIPSTANGYEVVSIGEYSIGCCPGLTSITIPNSVTSIQHCAFSGCSGLKNITIPNSVTIIGSYAFSECSNLRKVFNNSSLTLTYGSSDTMFPNAPCIYKNCTPEISGDFLLLVHADGKKYVCDYYGEETSITLPSVDGIEEYAFYNRSDLTSITIPNSVTSIGANSFYGFTGLASITIPSSVTSIGANSFYGCTGLASITIPNSITSIGKNSFSGCCNMTEVTMSNNVSIISSGLFYNCAKLSSITIPNSVRAIQDYAFYGCNKLSSITIPNSVKNIGDYAFGCCTGITNITIPNSVTNIGDHAFNVCTKLESITLSDSMTIVEDHIFRGCIKLTSITIPNSVTRINGSAFQDCTGLTNITIPNSVTSIGDNAFLGCSGLTSINIPNGLTNFAAYTFYGCSSLSSITIPNTVTSIGNYAFYCCSRLTNITIPNSVESIGGFAFKGCSGLTSITNFSTTPQTIASETFPEDGITLHVLPGYGDAYRTKSVWRDFLIKEDAVLPTEENNVGTFALSDGTEFTSDCITHATTLHYSRAFNNTNWQAMYIPFSMSYDDFSDDLEIAWLNNVHMYDDNNDGDPDRTMLEFYIMSNGETKPNTPYLVRSKETGTFSLSKSNADVYPAECDPFECSTFTQTFTVRGTYSGVSGADMYSNHYYAPVNGKLSFASSSNASLKPQRWYLKVTNKDGSNVTNLAPSIRMSIDGEVIEEEEETGICSTIDHSRSNKIYTLDGRRVSKPSNRGMFVQNNKIVIVK